MKWNQIFNLILLLKSYNQDNNINYNKNISNKKINKDEQIIFNNKKNLFIENIEDIYNSFLEKIDYITNIINFLGGSTHKKNFEYNINFLEENFEKILMIENIDKRIIIWYISEVKYMINYDDKDFDVKLYDTIEDYYNPQNAVTYANTYWKSYNKAYANWSNYGGDCANFISQCLRAGGKIYEGSNPRDLSNWFSKGNKNNINLVSATHRGANAFKYYWKKNAYSYKKFYKESEESFKYGNIGDVISLLAENDMAYHTLIIVNYTDNNEFIVASHTLDTNSSRLGEYLFPNGFIVYKMK